MKRPDTLRAAVALVTLVALAPSPAAATPPALARGVRLLSVEHQAMDVGLAPASAPDGGDVLAARHLLVHGLKLDATLPLPLDGRRVILVNRLSTRGLFVNDTRIGIFSLGASVRTALPGGWSLVPGVSLGLASDMGGVSRRDLFGGGTLIATKRLSPELSLGGGLAIAAADDGVLPVPLFLLSWTPSESAWLDLILPARFEAGLAPTRGFELALRARLEGARYALHANADVQRARHVTLEAGTSVAVRLTGGAHLRLDGGLVWPIRAEIQRAGFDEPAKLHAGDPGWFLRTTFEFRVFPTAKRD